MNSPFTLLKKTALALTLTFVGLAGSSQFAATSHAASRPSITAHLGSITQVDVIGFGFTAGGPVSVFVHNGHGRLIGTGYATATNTVCHGLICIPGGRVTATVWVRVATPSDTVIARDGDTGMWSYRTNA
jgi:hypothetical protein